MSVTLCWRFPPARTSSSWPDLIVLGTGLLKPNISTLVGDLYPEGGARRDAGFSIFYMGINLGAFLGPLIAGTVGEVWNWRGGFFCAGLFMGFGVMSVYKLTQRLSSAARSRDPALISSNAGAAGRPSRSAAPVVRGGRGRDVHLAYVPVDITHARARPFGAGNDRARCRRSSGISCCFAKLS